MAAASSDAKKRILITGGTDGIGKEMAERLLREGHTVGFTGRNTTKVSNVRNYLQSVIDSLVPRIAGQMVHDYCFDIGNLQEVNDNMNNVINVVDWDTVVFNAGVMFPPRRQSDPRDRSVTLEETIKTNIIGHYILARHLNRSRLASGLYVEFVFITSTMADLSFMPLPRWPTDRDHFYAYFAKTQDRADGWLSYIDSKLAAIVLAQFFCDPLNPATNRVSRSVAIHPGMANTAMSTSISDTQKWWISRYMRLTRKQLDTANQCAQRVIDEAILPPSATRDTVNSTDMWICEGTRKSIPRLSQQQKDAFIAFLDHVAEDYL